MRARYILAVLVLAALSACQMAARSVKPPPLDAEGEAWLYLQALPPAAERLEFGLEALVAVRGDGQEFPLSLTLPEISGKVDRRQRLLATGRLPPGEYLGVSVRVKRATLASGDGSPPANLLVPQDPVRVNAPFRVQRARARVLALTFDAGRSLDKGFGFRPVISGAVPVLPVVDLLGFVTNTGADAVTVYDKQSREVVAVLAAGRDPRGLAIDRVQGRLYVALAGGDEVAAYDLITGDEVGRARLQPGDRPQELGIGSGGQTLVVTCPGGNSVVFVDPAGLVEVGRVNTGMRPTALLMDRTGRRAYVFNQGSSNATVIDMATRAAAGTFATDGAVARAALSRNGERMYLVAPSSANMRVLSVPALATINQIQVGFNAVSVQVDPRTDYVYVSMGDFGQVQLFAPLTPLPVGRVDLPGPATWLAIDNTFDHLLGVVPSLQGVVSVELTSRRVLPMLDTGESPYATAVFGERR